MDRIFLEDVSRCVQTIMPWVKTYKMTLVNVETELLNPLPKLANRAYNFCVETIKAALSVLLEKVKANKLAMPAYDSILALPNDLGSQKRPSGFTAVTPHTHGSNDAHGAHHTPHANSSPSAPYIGQTPQSGSVAPAGNGLGSSGGSNGSGRAPAFAIHNPNGSSYLISSQEVSSPFSATTSDINEHLSRLQLSSASTSPSASFASSPANLPSQQHHNYPRSSLSQSQSFTAIRPASQVHAAYQPPSQPQVSHSQSFTAIHPPSQIYGPHQPYMPATCHSSTSSHALSSSSPASLTSSPLPSTSYTSSSSSFQHPPPRPLQVQAFPGPPPSLLPPSTVNTLDGSPAAASKPAIPRYLKWYAESKCPVEATYGFCRSRNLRFKKTCTYQHHTSFSHDEARLERLSPDSADYALIARDFETNWKLAMRPEITSIERVHCNEDINHAFQAKALEFASRQINLSLRQLYHGTHEHNIDKVLKDGFQPPSDCAVHESCPTWGKYCKDLQTSPCISSCAHCYGDLANRHSWAKCHMFGLGIYFADQSSKSDRYVRPASKRTERRMLLVDVLLGDPHIAKCLTADEEYHDHVVPPGGKNSIIALGKTAPKNGREVLNNECMLRLKLILMSTGLRGNLPPKLEACLCPSATLDLLTNPHHPCLPSI